MHQSRKNQISLIDTPYYHYGRGVVGIFIFIPTAL
jgi:hypothetical protein